MSDQSVPRPRWQDWGTIALTLPFFLFCLFLTLSFLYFTYLGIRQGSALAWWYAVFIASGGSWVLWRCAQTMSRCWRRQAEPWRRPSEGTALAALLLLFLFAFFIYNAVSYFRWAQEKQSQARGRAAGADPASGRTERP